MSPTLEIVEDNRTLNVEKGTGDARTLQGDKLPSSPSDGEIIRYNSTSGEWEHVPKDESVIVDAAPSADQVASYDGGWSPSDLKASLLKGDGVFNAGHASYGADPGETASNNKSAIQSAIDDAEASGGVAALTAPGTHEIDGTLTVDADDVTIYLGPGVTLKLADGAAGGTATPVIKAGDNISAMSRFTITGPGTIDHNRQNNTGDGNQSRDAPIRVFTSGRTVRFNNFRIINSIGASWDVRGKGTSESDWGSDFKAFGVTVENGSEGGFIREWRGFHIDGSCEFFGLVDQDAIELIGPGEQGHIGGITVWYDPNTLSGGSGIDIFDQGSGTFDRVTMVGPTIVNAPLQAVIMEGDGHVLVGASILDANQENAGGGGSPRASVTIRSGSNRCKVLGSTIESDGSADHPVLDAGTDSTVTGNTWSGHTNSFVQQNGSGLLVRDNQGWQQVDRGTATITSGNTVVAVSPSNLDVSNIEEKHIQVTPIRPSEGGGGDHLGSATDWWVDESIKSGNSFNIYVDTDPGQDIEFAWQIIAFDE